MNRRLGVFLALALLALALGAAGCGGGDDGGDDGAAVATTSAGDTTGGGDDSDSGDSSGSASADDCAELVALGTSLQQAFGATGSGDDVEEYSEFLDEFAERAPEEIRDDFAVVAEAFGKMTEALEGVDVSSDEQPSPDVIAKLQEAVSSIDQAAVTQASTNISTWASQNCSS